MYAQKQPDKQHEIVLWVSFVVSLAAFLVIASVESPLRDMIIFILLSMISTVSFMALALLRRARFGGMVVMSGILLVPAGVRLFSLDPITALHVHYSIFMFMAFLPVVCLLLVEWLYNYRSEAAVKCRELLLYSAIGAAILIVFSSIHPTVWLPLVALLYYTFYRRREDGYLGGAYLATIALVLLFLHWLSVPLSDNFTITAWVALVGFGVVYWSLNLRPIKRFTP
jgi:hypothetical protein